MSQIGFPEKIKKLLSLLTKVLTGLPADCTEVLIFGLTSGYPTGVKIAKLYADMEAVPQKSAKKAALLSVNPGIVYTVITVGKLQLGSASTGIIMYMCILLSQMVFAFITKKKNHGGFQNTKAKQNTASISQIFCTSVSTATDACFSLTAWIALFGAFGEIAKQFPLHKIHHLWDMIFEVTSAVSKSLYSNSVEQCTFSLGFGGLCLMFQLLPDLNRLNIKPWEYLSVRLFTGLSASLLMKLCRLFIPVAFVPAFAPEKTVKLSNNAASGFISVLFLCVIFMYSIANRLALC